MAMKNKLEIDFQKIADGDLVSIKIVAARLNPVIVSLIKWGKENGISFSTEQVSQN